MSLTSRLLVAWTLVWALAGALTASVSALAQVPVFRAAVDAVLVDVEVLDGGRTVTGLATPDFELLDQGVPQAIEAGSLRDVPIDLTLVLDTSGSVEGRRLDRIKTGVRDTAQWLRADDRWRVISVAHVLREVVPMQPASKPTAIDALQAGGGTALFDAVIAGLLRPRTPGRRQMVVIYTDGDDASSITNAAAMLDVARLSDAEVHVVVPIENAREKLDASGGKIIPVDRRSSLIDQATARSAAAAALPAESGQLFPNEDTFTELTARTGGRLFIVDYDDSVGNAFKRILSEYRTSYVLQYTPTGVVREGWHDLTVRVKRPGHLQVIARKGYWGG
jgi:VWFA-related protein